jgi:hypothetical protein
MERGSKRLSEAVLGPKTGLQGPKSPHFWKTYIECSMAWLGPTRVGVCPFRYLPWPDPERQRGSPRGLVTRDYGEALGLAIMGARPLPAGSSVSES